ncbi:hypothetical protein L9F63_020923 [Diploptera punctata]|uniref:Major facilitator superfamily (MFS) profile domain-containing protein n=1 Tax=Diploptera punctata TaxID=6984 RepID=A0AAD7ZQ86_DIPPU|nr:hypothetical protein L9F63_020923 [Diploptera punctata]
MHAAIARWVPPNEKSKFIWCTIGGTFGTMITFPLCGVIMDTVGWEMAFYFTAVFMLIICVTWYFLMHNTPQHHPRISRAELLYIQASIGTDISTTSMKFPTKKIFTSIPVGILVLLHIGDLWGLFFPMSYGPKYMKEALGFDIQTAGGLAALPYLARLVFGIFFSVIVDFLHTRKTLSTTNLRKIMAIFSHLVPAVFLFLVGVVGCDPYIAIACLTLSLGFNGASVGSCLANPHDLAPNFAATIFGIQNGVASIFSALSGFIAGAITSEKSGLKEWQIIWGLGGAVYVVTAVCFMLWGTGERQEWNEPQPTDVPVQMTNLNNKQT